MEQAGAFLTTAESVVFQLLKDSKHPNFRACSKKCVLRARSQFSKIKPPSKVLRLNTSNDFKFKEFERMFRKISNGTVVALERTKIDLREIDAAPSMVVAQKATSAGENVLIEDTSLDVDGADVGVNVRWIMDNLNDLVGRAATWRVLLGVLRAGRVHIYEGITRGTIVSKRGDSAFGFDPVFQPMGSTETLAESKPDEINARFKAVRAMLGNYPSAIHVPIKEDEWGGAWQSEH